MAVLPPGFSEAEFNQALNEFSTVVGPQWVLRSDDELAPYRDHWSPAPQAEDDLLASAAIAPASTEEVQALVRIANNHKVPIFPISTGKNFAYGGPAPNMRGTVVLDLKRMDKIIEVNDQRNYALVEPGVSYNDLYRYIQENDLKVWLDCPDPGWGSPIGNTMDRGIGYTMGFYRDHTQAMTGLEVVLADGEVMRTGTGAIPNSDTWQEYKHGFGPDPSGLFNQSNFGIVTKMGFRLMPQPEHWRTGLVTVPKRRDLIPLVNALNYLNDLNMMGEPWFGSPLRALTADADFREAIMRRNGGSDEELEGFARRAKLPFWQVELQFYGSDKITLAHWEYAIELITRYIPSAQFTAGESLSVPLTQTQLDESSTAYDSNMRRKVTQGVPGLGIWNRLGRSKSMPDSWTKGHVGMFAIIPRSGEAILKAQQVFVDALLDLGLNSGVNLLSTPLNWYQFSFLFSAGFSTGSGNADGSAESKEAINAGLLKMLEIAGDNGWGEYRAAPYYQDAVANQYSYNNFALRRFNERIKDAVDPNGILAPGRGGIWPASHRRGQV